MGLKCLHTSIFIKKISLEGLPTKVKANLKNSSFPIICIAKKSPGDWVKLLFTLLKLNITFYFKCYLHLDCSVNLNWNNTHIYSSAKPLRNVPGSVFWFENFCFLPILWRTRVQKWKKNWFCYVHMWIGNKEMTTKISKCLCRNLFIRATAQITAVLKDHEILVTLKRCITLSLAF